MRRASRCRIVALAGALAAVGPGAGGSLALVEFVTNVRWVAWLLVVTFGLLAAAFGAFAAAALVGCFDGEAGP
jgi:hypothetical protein